MSASPPILLAMVLAYVDAFLAGLPVPTPVPGSEAACPATATVR